MVDFSVKSTSLSRPDLKAASHISAGVTDVSGAMRTQATTGLAQGLGEQAIEAYKGKQIGDINTATQNTISEYMDSKETIFSTKEGETLSGVEKAQRVRLTTLKQALDEGTMTPDEFSDRVLANLREATNKTPGMFKELKEEAARVLELSGIQGVLKADQLKAESDQKKAERLLTDMQDRAKREHIYYDSTTTYWDLAEKVKVAENDTRAYDMQVRGKDRFSMLSTTQAREWTERKGNDVVRGSLSNANKLLVDMVDTNAVTTDNYPKFKAQFEGTLDNMHQVFVNSIPANIRQEPLVQENIRLHADGMEKVKTRLANLAGGEDMKKVMENEFSILKHRQENNLRKIVDVAKLDMTAKLTASVPGIITKSESSRKEIFDAFIAITSSGDDSPALRNIIPKSDKDNKSSMLLEGAINESISSGDYTSFKRTMDALSAQTSKIDNPKVRLQYLYNNINSIAKQKPMQLDVEGITKVETSIGQMLNDPNFGVGTLTQTTEGKKVQLDVLPSGHVVFIGEDSDKFNKTYANNINLALRAYANAHNTSMEKAAKQFYPKYFGFLSPTASTK